MKTTCLTLLFTVFLAACASKPTKAELESASYGTYPTGYEAAIRQHMSRTLKDPDSARYQILNPPKAYFHRGMAGYFVCANINAKNSFGAYVGNRMGYFIFREGSIIFDWHDTANLGALGEVGRLCSELV
jgi:hypothetical protein